MCRRGWGGINIKRVSNVDARARTCMTSILVLASSISVLFFRFTAASLNTRIITKFLFETLYILQCCGTVKHLVRIRISGSCFVRQWLTSSQQKISFFLVTFWRYIYISTYSKIKSKKEVTKKRNQGFSYFFPCWERIRIRTIWWQIRIREAQKHTDTDPPHWYSVLSPHISLFLHQLLFFAFECLFSLSVLSSLLPAVIVDSYFLRSLFIVCIIQTTCRWLSKPNIVVPGLPRLLYQNITPSLRVL